MERSLLNLGPPEEVLRIAAPVDSGVLTGEIVAGNHASLVDSDDGRLELMAARNGAGRSASLWASGYPEWSGQRIKVEVAVEFSSSPAGLVTLSLWDWSHESWVTLKTVQAAESDREHVLVSNQPELFVGPKDEIRVRVQRVEGRNRLFRLRTDRILFRSVSLE